MERLEKYSNEGCHWFNETAKKSGRLIRVLKEMKDD